MSIPREASRDTSKGICISVTPDLCRIPMGKSMSPIPPGRQTVTGVGIATKSQY